METVRLNASVCCFLDCTYGYQPYIHTQIYTYINTYIDTYILRTYIHTYIYIHSVDP